MNSQDIVNNLSPQEIAKLFRTEPSRARLEARDLESFIKTTRGKGLHPVVSITRGPTWDDCLEFSRGLAEELVREVPEAFVAVMSKAQRAGTHPY